MPNPHMQGGIETRRYGLFAAAHNQQQTIPSMSSLTDEIGRRRTFAIISHPDAGKTTLTEKLLLFGGAIQLAGEVRARGERRRTRSDWMAIERERGISVSSAVMSFEHEGAPSTCSTRRATRILARTPTAR